MKKSRDLKSLSDEHLMKQFVKHKNEEAFEVLYEKYFVETCRFINWLQGDIESAKDITQSLFVKIYQRPDLFDFNKNFKVWLFSSAKNYWKNELKAATIRKSHYQYLSLVTPGEEVRTDNDARLLRIKESLKNLSTDHQEVFILKYANNLSLKEIGEVCGCSLGTVKSRLFYALKNMRELVKTENNI